MQKEQKRHEFEGDGRKGSIGRFGGRKGGGRKTVITLQSQKKSKHTKTPHCYYCQYDQGIKKNKGLYTALKQDGECWTRGSANS